MDQQAKACEMQIDTLFGAYQHEGRKMQAHIYKDDAILPGFAIEFCSFEHSNNHTPQQGSSASSAIVFSRPWRTSAPSPSAAKVRN
jgi:hypothetical protein